MAKTDIESAVEFAIAIARECPEAKPDDVCELIRLSRRHARLQERACSQPVKEGFDVRCEESIRAVCGRIGVPVYFSGDPRGFTVKVKLPSGLSNHWGGLTFGVPQ